MKIYGLKTCDSCRKARLALEADGHTVDLVDVRAAPLAPETRARLLDAFGEALINRRSTTWRGLDDTVRAASPDTLLATYPALMKRPIIVDGDRMTLGWDAAARAVWLP